MKTATQRRVSTDQAPAKTAAVNSHSPLDRPQTHTLRDHVSLTVKQYLDALDGEMTTDVYQMVLSEVEAPLLQEIMSYTNDNQTRASVMLGLNRGTLRKKLKQYNMLGKGKT